MIPAWHLAWIIPVCVSFGMCLSALVGAGRDN